MSDGLAVSEVFGPTIQGEGPSAGRLAMFVRLARCNLDCSWCDTPYTWDWSGKNGEPFDPAREVSHVAITDIVAAVSEKAPLVVITGGEPLLQRAGFTDLAWRLLKWNDVEVETNGTRPPVADLDDFGLRYNVSVKLTNSGIPEHRRIVPDAILALRDTGKVTWKFVIADRADLNEVSALVDRFQLANVWVMPEGRTGPEVLERQGWLADLAIPRGWNVSTRLQVLSWGDRRGV